MGLCKGSGRIRRDVDTSGPMTYCAECGRVLQVSPRKPNDVPRHVGMTLEGERETLTLDSFKWQ